MSAALRVAAADLNGQARGKRMPLAALDKLQRNGSRMPLSALSVDIFGHDIEGSPLVLASGDADGVLRPTGRGPLPMPWLDTPSTLLPMAMWHEDGRPFAGDPRQALAAVVARLAGRGLSARVATEVEFYLVDDSGPDLAPPRSPRSGRRQLGGDVLSLRALDAFDAVLSELYAGAEAMGIAAETTTSEGGPGQFEMTLAPADPLRAADDAWLFKRLAQGVVRRHGLGACFLSKPYPDAPGSGLHVHVSLIGPDGANVFDDGGPAGTPLLGHAVAGTLAGMAGATLVFAPFTTSYARFVDGAHAPTGIGWGYENRTAALRIPGGAPEARRIEHRLAGAEANPYLLIACLLGAMLAGIEDARPPPPPLSGNAYAQELPQIPGSLPAAIEAAAACAALPRALPAELIDLLLRLKRQELAAFAALPPDGITARFADVL